MSIRSHTSYAKALLKILVIVGQEIVDIADLHDSLRRGSWAHVQGGGAYVRELRQLREEAVARQAIRSLRRSKYIAAKKIGKRLVLELTDKGRLAALAQQFIKAKKNQSGVYTVVIFDIPESERINRRRLRLLLRQGGFKRLQQSVWVSERDTYEQVVSFVRRMKIHHWVNVFRGIDFFLSPQ